MTGTEQNNDNNSNQNNNNIRFENIIPNVIRVPFKLSDGTHVFDQNLTLAHNNYPILEPSVSH